MQRRKDQVAGLGRCQGGLDGLQVAHFTDQDNIRVFTQNRPQGIAEAVSVLADLTLVDGALVRLVDILDRVFEGDDVFLPRMVDLVKDRGEGGGLTGTGLARDKDNALVVGRELADCRRQAKV